MAKQFSDEELKQRLTPEEYHSLREKGTEAPYTGKLLENKEQGAYVCPVCGNELFKSDAKYDSDTPGLAGWPSFYDVAKSGAINLSDDDSLGMHRVRVTCADCGSHLGHLFDDDTSPNGRHYCINSASLKFMPKNKA